MGTLHPLHLLLLLPQLHISSPLLVVVRASTVHRRGLAPWALHLLAARGVRREQMLLQGCQVVWWPWGLV